MHEYKTHIYSWKFFPMNYNSTINDMFNTRVIRVSINWCDKLVCKSVAFLLFSIWSFTMSFRHCIVMVDNREIDSHHL